MKRIILSAALCVCAAVAVSRAADAPLPAPLPGFQPQPAMAPPSGQMWISTQPLYSPQGMNLSTAPAAPIPYAAGMSTAAAAAPAPRVKEPLLLSGIVLTPTAYRSTGLNTLGPNLDINAAYYIGRLYGKNTYDWTTNKVNYIDRIGLWVLSADAKMLVQSETKYAPAMAAGLSGSFTIRDSPQPALDNPSVTINVKNSNALDGAYVVFTKKIHPRLITSLGYQEGTESNKLTYLSEFLTPQALELSGHPGQSATSQSTLFGGFLWMLKPGYPIGMEFIIPQGAPMHPKLFNIHLGTLLHLNFELAYLTYDSGWDLLGMFQFRYNYFPRAGK